MAARAGGSLVASFMSHDKKPMGAPKSYPGDSQMPDIARDGADTVLVAAQATGKGVQHRPSAARASRAASCPRGSRT